MNVLIVMAMSVTLSYYKRGIILSKVGGLASSHSCVLVCKSFPLCTAYKLCKCVVWDL